MDDVVTYVIESVGDNYNRVLNVLYCTLANLALAQHGADITRVLEDLRGVATHHNDRLEARLVSPRGQALH